MTDPIPVDVDDRLAARFAELQSAKESAAKWNAYAKSLTASILEELGYDPGDDKPPSRVAHDADGKPLFAVEVSYRKGFDKGSLATKYPAVYAEFETLTPVKSLKPAT
ncbi:hypothetical protein DMA15_03845 [Streptomyces sp. WAC 01529]|uniref:hypothetical protein n=1 Tax=Streptomyces sp. WAC 01529 TaxID=2203205 RepID=UPI000F71FFBE|nr:hypothetical protein [Streptomyces sp. WAC 01529]AZM51826.1 hypothetical protein DMA15_03845 [Streptomyces sp. WAC 01529]